MPDRSDPRWIHEGGFIRLHNPVTREREFFFVEDAFWGRFHYNWSATIARDTLDDQEIIEDLRPLALEHLFQVVFGVKQTDVFVYVDLPTGERVGGTPRVPRATSTNRRVGWFDADLSPYEDPSFDTEFFLQKGGNFEEPNLSAYNASPRTLRPEVRFELNKAVLSAVEDAELLDKLQRKAIPSRPVTMGALPPTRTGPG